VANLRCAGARAAAVEIVPRFVADRPSSTRSAIPRPAPSSSSAGSPTRA